MYVTAPFSSYYSSIGELGLSYDSTPSLFVDFLSLLPLPLLLPHLLDLYVLPHCMCSLFFFFFGLSFYFACLGCR